MIENDTNRDERNPDTDGSGVDDGLFSKADAYLGDQQMVMKQKKHLKRSASVMSRYIYIKTIAFFSGKNTIC